MTRDSSTGSAGTRRTKRAAATEDPEERRLAAVLGALAPEDASDAPVPGALLAAFAVHAGPDRARAALPNRAQRTGARARHVGRAAAVRAAVVVLAVSGGTAAAAAADILPATAQRAAHNLFGSWGVPAPHTAPGAGGVSPSAPATGTPATGAPGMSAQSSAAHPGVTPSTGGDCSAANTHAADARCAGAATADPAPATPGAGHATKTPGHGHTASPHGEAAR